MRHKNRRRARRALAKRIEEMRAVLRISNEHTHTFTRHLSHSHYTTEEDNKFIWHQCLCRPCVLKAVAVQFGIDLRKEVNDKFRLKTEQHHFS